MKLHSKLRPAHYVYLILHVVLFLLGIILVQLRSPAWVGVGSSLIAAAVTGWVIFVYVFQSQTLIDRLEVLTRFGLKDAFEGRSVRIKDEYTRRLDDVRDHIDVLGFGQRTLREDLGSEFAVWAQRATVRILLLDPDFPSKANSLADQRDLEERNSEKTIRKDVREFVRFSGELLRSGQGRFQVRLYTCLPSINIFRIDNDLFWGPYLVGDQSRNLPTFLVVSGGLLFDRLLRHFNQIWTSDNLSRPIPSEWIHNGP